MPTLADRVARGIAERRVYGDEIIPFPDGWDMIELSIDLQEPFRAEVITRLNDGWHPTLFRYCDEGGTVVAMTVRLDHPTGEQKKYVRPLRVNAMIGIRADVTCRALTPLRPLFGLDRLAARPDAPVLFTEGEKAAIAASKLFPDYVAMTWWGGARGVGKADFRPIAGRDTTIWPDNDDAGGESAPLVARAVLAAGAASARIVTVPANFPHKWDLANPVPSEAHD